VCGGAAAAEWRELCGWSLAASCNNASAIRSETHVRDDDACNRLCAMRAAGVHGGAVVNHQPQAPLTVWALCVGCLKGCQKGVSRLITHHTQAQECAARWQAQGITAQRTQRTTQAHLPPGDAPPSLQVTASQELVLGPPRYKVAHCGVVIKGGLDELMRCLHTGAGWLTT